ncbi:MAG: DegV family protein, partial [Bacilli bacterium]|nr:DegV family protein [Bacilli bacterium]
MNKVKIIVDSTVDLTKEIYEKYDIEVLPLNVSFEEETYQDGVNLDITTLFKKVEETGKLPHTSACSPELIRATFK